MDFTVDPLPFYNMSSFLYPPTESYPYDEEHIEYLKEYNTRVIEPKAPIASNVALELPVLQLLSILLPYFYSISFLYCGGKLVRKRLLTN